MSSYIDKPTVAATDASLHKANVDYLLAETVRLCRTIESIIPLEMQREVFIPEYEQKALLETSTFEMRLNQISMNIGLNATDRDILILCAGVEIDPIFRHFLARVQLFATVQQEASLAYPTFTLFSSYFPDFDWSAITEKSPLFRYGLINIGEGPSLTLSPLRISKRVFCFLLGQPSFEEKLQGFITPINVKDVADTKLQPPYQDVVAELANIWLESTGREQKTVVQLCGLDCATNINIAATACHSVGINLHVLHANLLPSKVCELNELVKLWEREALLTNSALLLDCHDINTTDTKVLSTIQHLVRNISSRLIISGIYRLSVSGQTIISLGVRQLGEEEQLSVWYDALDTLGITYDALKVKELSSKFNLTQETINQVVSYAAIIANTKESKQSDNDNLISALWDACYRIAAT